MTTEQTACRRLAALVILFLASWAPCVIQAQNPQRAELTQKFRDQLADIATKALN